jgi:hypothetical protein
LNSGQHALAGSSCFLYVHDLLGCPLFALLETKEFQHYLQGKHPIPRHAVVIQAQVDPVLHNFPFLPYAEVRWAINYSFAEYKLLLMNWTR